MNFPTSIIPGLSLPPATVRRADFARSMANPPLRARLSEWRRRAGERKAARAAAGKVASSANRDRRES